MQILGKGLTTILIFFAFFFGSNEIKCTFVTLLIQKTNFNLNHHENNQNRKHKQFKELH